MSLFWYQIIWYKEKTIPTHYKGAAEEIPALNTFIKLSRGAESVGTCLSRRGTTGHLPTSQFGVLESLYHLGPMCQSDIGSKLLKSNSNITFVIHNLEKRGLVRRERDG